MTGRSAYVTNIKEGIKNLVFFMPWYSVPNGMFLSLHLAALIVKWSPLGDSYAVAVGNKVVVYKLAVSPSLVIYSISSSNNCPVATFLFLRHVDLICDLLLNRHLITWIPFVLYNKELKRLTVTSFLHLSSIDSDQSKHT